MEQMTFSHAGALALVVFEFATPGITRLGTSRKFLIETSVLPG